MLCRNRSCWWWNGGCVPASFSSLQRPGFLYIPQILQEGKGNCLPSCGPHYLFIVILDSQDWAEDVRNELGKTKRDKNNIQKLYDGMYQSLGNLNAPGLGLLRKQFIQVCIENVLFWWNILKVENTKLWWFWIKELLFWSYVCLAHNWIGLNELYGQEWPHEWCGQDSE